MTKEGAPLTAGDLPGILCAIEQLRTAIFSPQMAIQELSPEIAKRLSPETTHRLPEIRERAKAGDTSAFAFIIAQTGEILKAALQPAGFNSEKKPEIDSAQLPESMRVQLGRLWRKLVNVGWTHNATYGEREEWIVFLDEVAAKLKASGSASARSAVPSSCDDLCLPAPTDRETCERVISRIERWKKCLYPGLPGEPLLFPELIELTHSIVAWRDLHAIRFDVSPLDEVRRIVARRAGGETTPEEELRSAGERAARACDRIEDWLRTTADLLDVRLPDTGRVPNSVASSLN